MHGMRDILKSSVSTELRALSKEDRIAAAWTIVCGRSLANRGTVVGFSEGTVTIEVTDRTWLYQMKSMQTDLEREVGRIAGVQITGINFVVKK
jgi:hypothetical protein